MLVLPLKVPEMGENKAIYLNFDTSSITYTIWKWKKAW